MSCWFCCVEPLAESVIFCKARSTIWYSTNKINPSRGGRNTFVGETRLPNFNAVDSNQSRYKQTNWARRSEKIHKTMMKQIKEQKISIRSPYKRIGCKTSIRSLLRTSASRSSKWRTSSMQIRPSLMKGNSKPKTWRWRFNNKSKSLNPTWSWGVEGGGVPWFLRALGLQLHVLVN